MDQFARLRWSGRPSGNRCGRMLTLTSDATEEMAVHYREYHPEAMCGEITIEVHTRGLL
jgi:hypothetical protein